MACPGGRAAIGTTGTLSPRPGSFGSWWTRIRRKSRARCCSTSRSTWTIPCKRDTPGHAASRLTAVGFRLRQIRRPLLQSSPIWRLFWKRHLDCRHCCFRPPLVPPSRRWPLSPSHWPVQAVLCLRIRLIPRRSYVHVSTTTAASSYFFSATVIKFIFSM